MENPFSTVYNTEIDLDLVSRSLTGDKKSLNELLIRHQDFIFNIAMKMLNGIPDAEDATQEVLIKIVTNLSAYDSTKAKFRTWLYRITFNHILNLKKSPYEQKEVNFTKFFGFMDSVPDFPISEEEETVMGKSIEESKVSCMAGMLMCLSREQRLVYIVGEIFRIDHHLGAEIFEISPDAFRKQLSRARQDIHQWMHQKCGLVNTDNPCRCRNKTRHFIAIGAVDPENLKWMSNFQHRIFELSETRLDEAYIARDEIYERLFREHPFKTNLKASEVYDEILNHRNFSEVLGLNQP